MRSWNTKLVAETVALTFSIFDQRKRNDKQTDTFLILAFSVKSSKQWCKNFDCSIDQRDFHVRFPYLATTSQHEGTTCFDHNLHLQNTVCTIVNGVMA